jgi:hypothetical protein
MGAILSIIKGVVKFFEVMSQIIVHLAKIIFDFFQDPIGTLIRLLGALIGVLIGVTLMTTYLVFKPLSYFVFPLLAYVIAWMYCLGLTLISVWLWVVYFCMAFGVFAIDFISGGRAFRLFLCEADPEQWVMRENYAHGNRCEKGLFCMRSCGPKYSPTWGGLLCRRRAQDQHTLCPQQYIYRMFMHQFDPKYATYLGKLPVKPPIFDLSHLTPAFYWSSVEDRTSTLLAIFDRKKKSESLCAEWMKPYEMICRQIFATSPFLFDRNESDTTLKVGKEVFCSGKEDDPSVCAGIDKNNAMMKPLDKGNRIYLKIMMIVVSLVMVGLLAWSVQNAVLSFINDGTKIQ